MSEWAGAAFILRPGEGRPIDLGGFRMSVKATHEQTNGAFTLLEAEEPAGFGPPLHIALRYSMEVIGPAPEGYV